MKTEFLTKFLKPPDVSFILLDWSCRESFHMMEYLSRQTVARDRYEICWIEYYSRRSPEIKELLEHAETAGEPPPVDQWIVMETPPSVYYHKHLMYNTGIVNARGRIIVLCDSDTMVQPTFVQSIIDEFEKDENIVLHLDEVRSKDRRFYPFNHPTVKEILENGCINWAGTTTTGILEELDPLHTRNYGACFAALRKDLIEIGGADEHIDYLGHICGPYELTFRLINAGKREIWHPSEFLYHTWHPGTDGDMNYLGPHDGRNMSTTALEARRTGRIQPYVENFAIQTLRQQPDVLFMPPEETLIPYIEMLSWSKEKLAHIKYTKENSVWSAPGLKFKIRYFLTKLELLNMLLAITLDQIVSKFHSHFGSFVMQKSFFDKLYLGFRHIWRLWQNNRYTVQSCKDVIESISKSGVTEIALYGEGQVIGILSKLLKLTRLELFGCFKPGQEQSLTRFDGPVIIATFTHITESLEKLKISGIKPENIYRLQ